MARITGKNAKIQGELTHTDVTSDVVMTDSGDHLTYSYQAYWIRLVAAPIRVKVNGGVVAANTYIVNLINGTVTFLAVKNPSDVIKVCYFSYATLVDVGDMYNWVLDAKVDVVPVTAFQDQFRQQLSGFRNWNATAEGYHVSGYWFNAFNNARPFYVTFYPDASALERFVGATYIDLGINCAFDAVVKETVTMNGHGELSRKTT